MAKQLQNSNSLRTAETIELDAYQNNYVPER